MKWALTLVGLGLLLGSFIKGFLGNSDLVWPGIVACMALVLMANIDQLERLKVSLTSLEASMRQTITEAKVSIVQLRDLAVLVSELTVELIHRQGRLGSLPFDVLEREDARVAELLKGLDTPPEIVDSVLERGRFFHRLDYARVCLGGSRMISGLDPAQTARLKDLKRAMNPPPAPDTIQEFLEHLGIIDEAALEWLADYRYFLENKKHRRPELFKDVHSVQLFK